VVAVVELLIDAIPGIVLRLPTQLVAGAYWTAVSRPHGPSALTNLWGGSQVGSGVVAGVSDRLEGGSPVEMVLVLWLLARWYEWCPPVSRPYVAFKRVVPDSLHPGLVGRRVGAAHGQLRDVIPTARRARPDPLVSVAPAQAAAAASSRWWCRPAAMAGSQGVLVTITVLSAALVHVLLALVVAVVLVVVAVTLLVFPGNSPHPRRIPAASPPHPRPAPPLPRAGQG